MANLRPLWDFDTFCGVCLHPPLSPAVCPWHCTKFASNPKHRDMLWRVSLSVAPNRPALLWRPASILDLFLYGNGCCLERECESEDYLNMPHFPDRRPCPGVRHTVSSDTDYVLGVTRQVSEGVRHLDCSVSWCHAVSGGQRWFHSTDRESNQRVESLSAELMLFTDN